jgi:hypothetical protein
MQAASAIHSCKQCNRLPALNYESVAMGAVSARFLSQGYYADRGFDGPSTIRTKLELLDPTVVAAAMLSKSAMWAQKDARSALHRANPSVHAGRDVAECRCQNDYAAAQRRADCDFASVGPVNYPQPHVSRAANDALAAL